MATAFHHPFDYPEFISKNDQKSQKLIQSVDSDRKNQKRDFIIAVC